MDFSGNLLWTLAVLWTVDALWTLTVPHGPPETTFVRELPKIAYVEIGGRAVLECELGTKYSAKWMKNQKHELHDDKTFSITSFNYTHTLTISKIKRSDLSVYSCECGSAKTICEIRIEEPLEFKEKLVDKFSCRGDEIVLKCRLNKPFNGEPRWTKDGKDLPEIKFHIKKQNTPFTKKLTLLNFERNDAGIYKCICDSASTEATIRIQAVTNQAPLTYIELEQRNRECREELENQKVTVRRMELEKEDLKRQVEEMKTKSESNDVKILEAEEKISAMKNEIDCKNYHIESLKGRMASYSKELQKKEKVIQELSTNFSKLMEVHENRSNARETQDTKFSNFINEFDKHSTQQRERKAEREQHEKNMKELLEKTKKVEEEKQKAEDNARKAEHAKQLAENKFSELAKEKHDIQKQKHDFEEHQKLAKTEMRQIIIRNQQTEKDMQKVELELKNLTKVITTTHVEIPKKDEKTDNNRQEKQPVSIKIDNHSNQIEQKVREKDEIEIQKQQVEEDLKLETQKRKDLETKLEKLKKETSTICAVS